MYFRFNPLQTKYKSVTGGVKENTPVRFFVESSAPVTMRIYSENDYIDRLMKKTEGGFYLDFELDKGLYFYQFFSNGLVFGKGEDFCAKPNKERWQLTVYPKDYATPDWIKGGIIYQIFPDRFCKVGDFEVGKGKKKREDWGGLPIYRSPDGKVRNNEFFGGNFKGIQSKLDYIKELGVDAIYLNPICESYSSHRYDTGNYLKPDSVLGSIEDFKKLTKAGKEKGIYFIFDGVFNHTGAGSIYFNKYNDYQSIGAYNSKESTYFDWFTFWEHPDSYASWWGFKTLPTIKKDSKSFQAFVCDKVVNYWLDAGVRGMRLDVVDELTDKFVYKIRKALKTRGDNFLIGEVWEDATNKIAYGVRRKYYTDGLLDSVMNYPLRSAIIEFALTGNSALLVSTVNEQLNNYPKEGLDTLMNVLSTHDSIRIITLLGRRYTVTDKDLMAAEKLDSFEYERGKEREKIATVLQFFLYGVPSVYYGDEEGLEGDLDPYNRRCFDWVNGDKELTEHYKKLAHIRKSNSAFKCGSTNILKAEKDLFIFTRGEGKEQITIALNRSNHAKECIFSGKMQELYSNKKGKKFELPANGFLVLKAI
ncbi:MAG: glycoside hydrolase family 13 protein [Clostridia bacterium]|nr:glycoside hydrolase family 13 protein [Clostridia bacterium]